MEYSKITRTKLFFAAYLTLVGIVLTTISFTTFKVFEHINYYNIVLELMIAFGAGVLLFSIQSYKEFSFFKMLRIGYFLLFISFFVDSLDQVFEHNVLYTVVMEKLTLVFGAIATYIGSKQWMENYKTISLTDELTKIPNRKHARELIIKEINNCTNNSSIFCLVICDIDLFKQLNDEYGHYSGDKVLVDFAQLLNQHKRPEDIIGRWGGEEFTLILKNMSKQEGLIFAEELRHKIRKKNFLVEGNIIKLTASFGVSQFSCPEYDFKKLFVEADKALYKAKNSGRNKVM